MNFNASSARQRRTPFFSACAAGLHNVVRFFLSQHDVDVRATSRHGVTAYHTACFGRHLEVVKVCAAWVVGDGCVCSL